MIDVKSEIFKAAIELFAKSGYHLTSIRDISKQANVNSSMINYYFESKQNLYLTIFKKLQIDLIEICDTKLYDQSPNENLIAFLVQNMEYYLKNEKTIKIYFSEEITSSINEVDKLINQMQQLHFDCFMSIQKEDSKEISEQNYFLFFGSIKSFLIKIFRQKNISKISTYIQFINFIETSLITVFNIQGNLVLK